MPTHAPATMAIATADRFSQASTTINLAMFTARRGNDLSVTAQLVVVARTLPIRSVTVLRMPFHARRSHEGRSIGFAAVLAADAGDCSLASNSGFSANLA